MFDVKAPLTALFGRVGLSIELTELSYLNANAFAEGIPLVDDVGNDDAFPLLGFYPLCF